MMRYEITCTKEEKTEFERLRKLYLNWQNFLMLTMIIVLVNLLFLTVLMVSLLPEEPLLPFYLAHLPALTTVFFFWYKDTSAYKKVERKLLAKAEWRELD